MLRSLAHHGSRAGLCTAMLVAVSSTPRAQVAAAAPHAFAGIDAPRLARVDALLRGEVEAGHCAGVSFVLFHQGHEVAFAAHGLADLDRGTPLRRDTIVRIYSMSKPITSIAALVLFEQGRFRLDTPIVEWLPELADLRVFTGGTADAPETAPLATPITVRMLLNHTAGFTYDFFRDSPVQELYRRTDLWNSPSLDEFVRRVAKLPLLAEPGTGFHYSICDDVLGALIERVSGMPFADFVRENVTGPLGMRDTDFDVPESKRDRLAALHTLEDGKLHTVAPAFGSYAEEGHGFASGGGGMFATLDDYARFARMLRGKGELDGVRIVSRKVFELGALDSLPVGQHSATAGDGWGLFSAVRTDVAASLEPGSVGALHWSGAATTHFFVDPTEDVVAVLFYQHLPFDQHKVFPRFHTAIYQALR